MQNYKKFHNHKLPAAFLKIINTLDASSSVQLRSRFGR